LTKQPPAASRFRLDRRTVVANLGLLAVGGAGVVVAQGLGPRDRPAARVLTVAAHPIPLFERDAPDRHTFTRLEFRGGLVLRSPDASFGGWSGLEIDNDGRRLLMISDRGSWLTADLEYDGIRPRGLANALIGPIGIAGVARQGGRDSIRDYDAEAVSLLDGNLARGRVLIAFERTHRIGIFSITELGLEPQSAQVPLPAEARRLPGNRGIEAVAVLRGGAFDGSIVAFAEEPPGGSGDHVGWIWTGGVGTSPLPIRLANIGGFAVTDLASLPGGGLLVLERRFRFTEGVRFRIRQIDAKAIRPGAILTGEVLAQADQSYQIDNMEGLAVHRDARGKTVLTLISDDNFNPLFQRSILLQFTLADIA
jgi:hypothetical protein